MTPHPRQTRRPGGSRDFTVSAPTTSTTALLERDQRVRAPRPVDTPLPKRHPRRTGSRQVVSVRGRRVSGLKQPSMLTRLISISIGLAVFGVAVAMWLSGMSTQQTFQIQLLQSQDKQLSNQLETLNRDLENVRSSAELARRAGELGMAVPVQPGILSVRENGEIVEDRPADPATLPLVDVNGAPVRPGQASSDPRAISELGDTLEAVPQGHQLRSPEDALPAPVAPEPETGVLPYAPNVPEATPPADDAADDAHP